ANHCMPFSDRHQVPLGKLRCAFPLAFHPVCGIKSIMRLPFSLGLLLTLAITTFGAPEFKSIFDGRTLDGWEPHGHGKFRVDNETILCETGNGTYGWLFTKKTYGDFILDLEVKHDATGNSGVQVRSHLDEKETMIGYQFDIDPGRPST